MDKLVENPVGQDFPHRLPRRIDLASICSAPGEGMMRFVIFATSWFAVAGLAAAMMT